ncbi:hypothetical protein EIN_403570 [Entamoeba invadens IP1]|uniref:TLDc domain-containing protein n=1 Tax=Entamoeba invadens IP1 TaxID=370355 RepID=A0A0A1U6H8_ENTIV|nr:hypothetical protein EIN_403570 [Entamoeba invadens IP1]ELP90023.1 hypothetical protein EIN_403570 [Entamoeba invadens IP1]|eukprot:XP_004256794.1 hypothetical protein EIN_403570 [Entamoeba invadens IP1]
MKCCEALELIDYLSEVNYLWYLQEWTSKEVMEIIYDSDELDITSNIIENVLSGRQNIVLLFETTQGELFGCYNKSVIKQNSVGFVEDKDFFVFSFKSKSLLKPTKYVKKCDCQNYVQNDLSLYFPHSTEYVIDTASSFLIYLPLNDWCSEINIDFNKCFEGNAADFVGQSCSFALRRFLVIQMW